MEKLYTLEELKLGTEYTLTELANIPNVTFYLSDYKVDPEVIGRGILVSINNNPEITFEQIQEKRILVHRNISCDLQNKISKCIALIDKTVIEQLEKNNNLARQQACNTWYQSKTRQRIINENLYYAYGMRCYYELLFELNNDIRWFSEPFDM